jgi:type IV secretion system protein VirB1
MLLSTQMVSLGTLAHLCAPTVAPNTMLAIIQVESGGNPWAIDDDTTHHSYGPHSYEEARALADELFAEGHNLDIGLAQVNTDNLPRYGVSVDRAFDPCLNVTLGADIISRAYRASRAIYGPTRTALYHAFEIYNSGHANGAQKYADAVWSAGLSIR